MAEANQQQVFDRLAPISSPERVVELQNGTDEAPIPKDERVVLVNPPSVVTVSSTPTNVKDLTVVSDSSGSLLPTTYPYNAYTPQDPGFYYGGYDNGITWDDQTSYMNASNLHIVPPPMYNDASSMFYSGHGYDGSMGYGQYSPIPSPISPIMIDGQLYSTHQIPVSPSYYPPVSPGLPHVSSSLSGTQTELMASGSSSQENLVDLFSPGSGFYIPFGSFSSAELSGNTGLGYYKYPAEFGASEAMTTNQSNALDAGRYMNQMTPYPQAMGMYGAYDQNVNQGAYQGMGYGSNSMARRDAYNYPSSGSASRWQTGQRNRLVPERNMGRRERDRELFNSSPDMTGMINDRNRGPRAARMMKVRSIGDESEDVENRFDLDMYNRADFVTDLEDAKFFVIKSFSEDNVHKSIKYNVWASTPLGNRKLDAAFTEATEKGNCPVYLLFSVNASGQFCGVAEMVGNVDFEKDAEYWQLDRWSGQFPVKWLFVKDVPNSRFRHIILENNDNKPVTHSRDSQEVSLEQGLEMLKIFKSHEMDTSLFDDFIFYDEREKLLLERKAKQRALAAAANAADANVAPPVAAPVAESINKLSDNLADTLNLDGGGVGGAAAKKAAVKPEL